MKKIVMVAIALIGACAAVPEHSYEYEPGAAFCGIRIGAVAAALPPRRRIVTVPTEAGPEERWEIDICAPPTPAEIAFDRQQNVERIILRAQGACVNGICVGETYEQTLSRRPDVELHATSEEGGAAWITAGSPAVVYHLSQEGIEIACFQDPSSCDDQWRAASIDAIIMR